MRLPHCRSPLQAVQLIGVMGGSVTVAVVDVVEGVVVGVVVVVVRP
jgi:hypothetical protein